MFLPSTHEKAAVSTRWALSKYWMDHTLIGVSKRGKWVYILNFVTENTAFEFFWVVFSRIQKHCAFSVPSQEKSLFYHCITCITVRVPKLRTPSPCISMFMDIALEITVLNLLIFTKFQLNHQINTKKKTKPAIWMAQIHMTWWLQLLNDRVLWNGYNR